MNRFRHLQICASILLFASQLTDACALPSRNTLTRKGDRGDFPQHTSNHVIGSQRSSLKTRSPDDAPFQQFLDIGDGWNLYHSSWHAASLPIQPAAWVLTNLYASMLTNAQTTWRKTAPQYILPLVIGQIQLIMVCPTRPIPWEIVEDFASEMLRITGDGWTGLYQVLLSQAEEDISIAIELTVLPGP